ncbi:protein of unknown function [Taphrina deformans PYCC 5710]|uniref:Uncharacterized protein n=1 Tax=Taphrina deformans (strain PYCC 5710 / ATCC 11124 / CBS 356.35 / IMI 108563 / JCM 9778 / NBRC 8474) TaxID=1097556 RepID=R4XA85_TAPDE|nr:protein of unknown function [Taphrina deformans PYCC 5710]|eukprot:CCG81184.1 protein of unknown function [Taphrina deformans PYCC 5710]
MSKRATLEGQDELNPVEKKAKLADDDQKDLDQEAEWAAFQALIGESGAEPVEEQDEKDNIELADDDESPDGEDDGEGLRNGWDEDDMNVERRLENQEARKKYLVQLRARRIKQETTRSDDHDKTDSAATNPGTDKADTVSADEDDDEEDDDDDDEGWIK